MVICNLPCRFDESLWMGEDSNSWCNVFAFPCRTAKFPEGVEEMVWFDDSESLPTSGTKYKHISNLNQNSNSHIPVFEISDSPSHQSEGLITRKSDQESGTILNIPMYTFSISLKTNGLKPPYMNEKDSRKNRNNGLQNKLKLRVN
jgi:hypothetical protein